MNILLAYGSNTGATKEIAEFMTKQIESEGNSVALVDLKKTDNNPEAYDLVIIGSGIKVGSWIKEADSFLDKPGLKDVPHALFVSSGFASVPSKKEEAQQRFLDDVVKKHGLKPVSTGLFGGKYDWSKYNFVVKMLVMKILKDDGVDVKDTRTPLDYRDWAQIEEWARELLVSL